MKTKATALAVVLAIGVVVPAHAQGIDILGALTQVGRQLGIGGSQARPNLDNFSASRVDADIIQHGVSPGAAAIGLQLLAQSLVSQGGPDGYQVADGYMITSRATPSQGPCRQGLIGFRSSSSQRNIDVASSASWCWNSQAGVWVAQGQNTVGSVVGVGAYQPQSRQAQRSPAVVPAQQRPAPAPTPAVRQMAQVQQPPTPPAPVPQVPVAQPQPQVPFASVVPQFTPVAPPPPSPVAQRPAPAVAPPAPVASPVQVATQPERVAPPPPAPFVAPAPAPVTPPVQVASQPERVAPPPPAPFVAPKPVQPPPPAANAAPPPTLVIAPTPPEKKKLKVDM